MLKTVAAGAAALMIAAGGVAFAQSGGGGAAGPEPGRHHFSPQDRAAFLNARLAALHAGLQLTPDQEKSWPAFEKAYRGLAALRGHHWSGPRGDEPLDPIQRAQRRAAALTARGAALKSYADALTPLYKSLDDGQKRRFGVLVRFGHHRHFHRFAWRNRERGGPHAEFLRHREFSDQL